MNRDVFSGIDSTLVHKNVASKNHNVCYDAKLVGINGERASKPKKVLCYVSPKQLIIKELILKFIPKRLFTFRLCPSTKVSFNSTNKKICISHKYTFLNNGLTHLLIVKVSK